MAMTQRGQLSPQDEERLHAALLAATEADVVKAELRTVAVEMVEKSSYREVGRLIGVSTNTLQRWVREARA